MNKVFKDGNLYAAVVNVNPRSADGSVTCTVYWYETKEQARNGKLDDIIGQNGRAK